MVQHVETREFEDEMGERIQRGDTGVRALKTLLFLVIYQLVEAALTVLVVFSLLWAFLTRTPPSPRVRRFGARVLAYGYGMGRYVTYNDDRAPFPFDDFPEDSDF